MGPVPRHQRHGHRPPSPGPHRGADVHMGQLLQRGEPVRRAGQFVGHARKQVGHHALGVLLPLHPPALGRRVERHPQSEVPRGGDGGLGVQGFRDLPRHPVGPVVPAQERHDHRAVVRHRQDRRLGALVRQERRDGTDEDAARADPDHRVPRGEEVADMGQRVGEGRVAALGPLRPAMERRVEACGHAARDQKAGCVDRDHDGSGRRRVQSHGSAPLVTRMVEK